MNDISIKTLGDVSIPTLLEASNAAFGDYQVKIHMTEQLLISMLNQNGVKLDKSIGAFDGGKLVGFWLNGIRAIDGVLSAYDSGTAICPEYRSQGISKMMSKESYKVLRENGIKEYILEVMIDNDRAKGIYLKDGFEIARDFICFKATTPICKRDISSDDDVVFTESEIDDNFMNAKQDMEYAPSWQNRDESVLPIADQMRGITVTKGDRVLGYGIVQTTRGRIPQIGFANDVWNTEIPFLLLERLGAVLKEGSEIAIINVDENAPNTIKLFQDAGFEELVRQYEMKKNLT